MDIERDALENVKEVLKAHPRGMSITEISSAIGMNRVSVAKYMEMLIISGHVDVKNFGSSKVFFPSQRLPISAILSLSSDFIIILDKDLKIVNANDKFLEFYNIKREGLINRNVENLSFPIEFNPPITGNIKEALGGKESVINVYYKRKKDDYYFIVKFVPMVFEDGEKGVTIIFIDVTEQRKTELAIKDSEKKLRSIIEQSTDGIILTDERGTIIEYNKGEEAITGIKRVDALGENVLDFLDSIISEEDRVEGVQEGLKKIVKKMLATGNSPYANRHIERTIRFIDGKIKTIQFVIFPIKTENGYMVSGITRDITDRKRMEDNLRDSENKYRTLSETSMAPIMIAHGDKFI
jgi:PAS domain S-box-containing protein